ncbi:carbonic anhydrase 14 isoform X3 [Anolis carolinensis]|uniref:carbonic anhydrase 14 isoform X3 n=1 Tax=Anolis carolinensis TaxID=28377 RepID=UPI002F2B2B5A
MATQCSSPCPRPCACTAFPASTPGSRCTCTGAARDVLEGRSTRSTDRPSRQSFTWCTSTPKSTPTSARPYANRTDWPSWAFSYRLEGPKIQLMTTSCGTWRTSSIKEIQIDAFDVRDLLPAHLGHYFRYNGSLTTPPCYQSVLWTVFHQPASISLSQLEKLQKSLYATDEGKMPEALLVDNFRDPQNVNQRVVYSSFITTPSGYSAGEIVAIIFGVLLGCLGVFLAGWIVAKRIRDGRMQEQKGVVFTSSTRRAISD